MPYYQPGMTVAQQQALSVTLPAETRKNLLATAVSLLPSCRSQAFEDCIAGKMGAMSDCQAINDGWIGDYNTMEATVEKMPYCAEPPSTGMLVGGAFAAFAVGLALGMLVSR